MTILNVWGGPSSTVVSVDTATIEPDGCASGHASKLHVMPACRSVFAWRGLLVLGMHLAPPAMSLTGSLDDLEAVLPEWLQRVIDNFAAQGIHPGRGIDFLASGWSVKRGRLATIGHAYTDAGWRAMDELGRRMTLTTEMFPPDFDPAPQVASEAQRIGKVDAMHQLMRRQVAAWRLGPQAEDRRKFFDCGGFGIVAHLIADGDGRTTIAVHNTGPLE